VGVAVITRANGAPAGPAGHGDMMSWPPDRRSGDDGPEAGLVVT
jgi:hypothetical protein